MAATTPSVTRADLTPEEIVAAADEIMSEVGVAGLTIKQLSTKLGVSMGAMYHHVASKDAVIGMVAQGIYARIECPGPEIGNWVTRCRTLMLDFYGEMRRYPGLTAYAMAHLDGSGPTGIAADLHELLLDAGFSAERANAAITTLFFYGSGALLSEPILTAASPNAVQSQYFATGLDHVLTGIRADLEH
jgi:TetR/AcrR family transcriptional regulator, tetracycline repressor protein